MDDDPQSNGSDTETVDYSKPVPDCCKLEKSSTLGEDAEDDNIQLLLMIVMSHGCSFTYFESCICL